MTNDTTLCQLTKKKEHRHRAPAKRKRSETSKHLTETFLYAGKSARNPFFSFVRKPGLEVVPPNVDTAHVKSIPANHKTTSNREQTDQNQSEEGAVLQCPDKHFIYILFPSTITSSRQ